MYDIVLNITFSHWQVGMPLHKNHTALLEKQK